jgi:uncharacterized protein YjbJ (UPF0337 family)
MGTAQGKYSRLQKDSSTGMSILRIGRLIALWRKRRSKPFMNWDRIEGNWKQLKGKAREKWGKLTDNDWEQVAGKKDQLIGRIQERYGITKEEARRQADEWARAQSMETHEKSEQAANR